MFGETLEVHATKKVSFNAKRMLLPSIFQKKSVTIEKMEVHTKNQPKKLGKI